LLRLGCWLGWSGSLAGGGGGGLAVWVCWAGLCGWALLWGCLLLALAGSGSWGVWGGSGVALVAGGLGGCGAAGGLLCWAGLAVA